MTDNTERYLLNFGDIIERMARLFAQAEDARLAARFNAGTRPEAETARIVDTWRTDPADPGDAFGFDLKLVSPQATNRPLVQIRFLADPLELEKPRDDGARIGLVFFVTKMSFPKKLYPPALELTEHINDTVIVLDKALYEACRQLTAEAKTQKA